MKQFLPNVSETICEKFEQLIENKYAKYSTEWQNKSKEIIYHLSYNYEWFMEKYSSAPENIFNQDSISFSSLAPEKKKMEIQLMEFNELVKKKFGDQESKTVFCKKCGTESDVEWNTKQTRSADEGSTIFCVCKKCKSRWKM